MAETDLPEDVIVNILCWLPVKSLIRFTSVSKRWRFIILSDPTFASSQFKAALHRKTLKRRLLYYTEETPQLESLDLDDTPSCGVSRLSSPPEQRGRDVTLLGSCNGLVFVAFDDSDFYIWNPATRFVKQLPEPGFPNDHELKYYGAGYLSAKDDYRVFAASHHHLDKEMQEMKTFSLQADFWKTIQHPVHDQPSYEGTLLKEALLWIKKNEILAFDLAQEEFRTMSLPEQNVYFGSIGVSEGCLCVCPNLNASCYVDFWVRREYDADDSWTKLFNFSYSPEGIGRYQDVFFVMGSCTVALKKGAGDKRWLLVKIDHEQEQELGMYMTEACWFSFNLCFIPYEESLLWINH